MTLATSEPHFAEAEAASDAIPVWPVREDALAAWREGLDAPARAWAEAQDFQAKRGSILALPDAQGAIAGIAFGLGDKRAEGRIFGKLPLGVPEGTYRLAPVEGSDVDPARAALGWLLGSYAFHRFGSPDRAPASLVAPDGVDAARLLRMAKGMALARDLVNLPTSELGPAELEGAVRFLAGPHGAEVSCITGDALLAENYPMIHTVGRAGPQEPRLIDLRWAGPDARLKVTVIGKGVCFDTGGLDIKPSAAMLAMKKDMGGAAAALALASMVMEAKLPVTLRVLVPAVENSVASNSFRPGDVLTARNGITVENRNTDAEGRLILADALVEAASEKPDLMFDLATLTGAARVALGPDLPPFYTGSDELAAEILAAGEALDDPLWRMPLWDGYESDLSSSIAKITNAPGGGMAGSVTAALFLRRFVEDPERWAHFDIYAWAPNAKPGRPLGGECQAAMALYRVIEDRCT